MGKEMPAIDVSAIVTLHRGTKYLARTLASLSEAARFARARGLRIELVAVLDRPDQAMRAAWQDAEVSAFDNVVSITVDNGSPGLSRNDGCAVATGTYLDLIDGDDLISYSYFVRMHEAAWQLGPGAILVPCVSFGFGGAYYTVEYFSQIDVIAMAMITEHLLTVKIFAHRTLFAENRYIDIPSSSGYAFEDWHFSCNAIALGYRFFAVDGTALFYRQRVGSVNDRAMHMSTRQIPPSALFRPPIFLSRFADEAYRLEQAGTPSPLPTRGAGVLDDPVYRDIIVHANAIDPAVELGRYQWNCLGHYSNLQPPELGLAYFRACKTVGDLEFDQVFLLPGLASSLSPDPVAQAMHAAAIREPAARILALYDGTPVRPSPSAVTALDLRLLCGSLPEANRDVIALKLLQSAAGSAALHCDPSDFARRFFSRFAILLRDRHVTCYRPADRYHSVGGLMFADPAPFAFVSEHLDVIDRIVVSDRETMDADLRRLSGMGDKWDLRLQSPGLTAKGDHTGQAFMADERLHFTTQNSSYNAMSAAEHVVRYHCLRQLCRGKRVLDVACGEGYGSALLAAWGAAEVVGVDISADGIAVAQQMFARPNTRFLQGDACRLQEVLGEAPAFDLIVSFETIEHVPDVPALLAGICRYRAEHGTIVISCPNDHVEEVANPYHMRLYTFDEFRSATTAVLGPASGWLLGTPALGQILYSPGDAAMENDSDRSMALITECRDLANAAVLPAQQNMAPAAGTCRFYLGFWGSPIEMGTVVSPQSFPASTEAWRAVAWFKQQDAVLNDRLDDLRIAKGEVDRQLADIRRRLVRQARRAPELLAEAGTDLAEIAEDLRMRAELEQWQQFQQSRTYRLMQAYVRSYSLPVAGPVLRRLRRIAGTAARSVRSR